MRRTAPSLAVKFSSVENSDSVWSAIAFGGISYLAGQQKNDILWETNQIVTEYE